MANYRVIGTDGREYTAASPEDLRRWIGEGRINAATLVCAEGSLDWQPLENLPQFRPFVTPRSLPQAVSGPVRKGYRRTNAWALWGFICGLLSLTLCSCCCLPLDLVGVVCSVVGLVQIGNNPDTQSGTVLAILGLVLSVMSLMLGFIFSTLWLSGGAAEEFMREVERELRLVVIPLLSP